MAKEKSIRSEIEDNFAILDREIGANIKAASAMAELKRLVFELFELLKWGE